MSDLVAVCQRLIAVVGERVDKTAPVTLGAHEWEAFVAAVPPLAVSPAAAPVVEASTPATAPPRKRGFETRS